MALISNAILAVLLLTATAVLLPKLTGAVLGLVFRGVGWLIWRRTRSRREYVIARARSEEQESRAPRPKVSTNSLSRNGAEDEDWEKVDSLGPAGVQTATSSDSSGSAGGIKNRNSDDWDGIIGFFHPFWYDHFPQHGNASADFMAVMLVEVENVCFGKQCAQHRSAGQRPSVPSIQVTMKSTRPPC